MTDATTHNNAKLERMSKPVPVTVKGNVIEQKPALVGPFKRSDIELLLEAVKLTPHLNLVAGAAEALILQAFGLQEKFNPESYEISAFEYLKLSKAIQLQEQAESST